MKKRIGFLLLVVVLAFSLCGSFGLISASAAADTSIQVNPGDNTLDKSTGVPPFTGPQVNIPGLTNLSFEGLPDKYNYAYGNENIGNYYPGVNIGPHVVIADAVIGGYNDSGYPPHSGNAVFGTEEDNYADFIFDTPVSYVQGWFTFTDGQGYMEAYGALDSLIDRDSIVANYGYNSHMAVSGTGIQKVRIHDEGGYFTGDDISYGDPPESAPGLSQWGILALVVLFGGVILGLILRKQIRSQIQ